MKSILDPAFKYVPAASTDLKKTFARIRREQAQEAERMKASNVKQIKRLKAEG